MLLRLSFCESKLVSLCISEVLVIIKNELFVVFTEKSGRTQ